MVQHRVWIVEDEAIVALDLKFRLEAMGYEVAGISSYGEDAVEKIREHRPDLVMMDIVLKGEMDGITAADIIRSEYDVPIIYLTAYSDDDTVSRAKSTEPFGYIIKPLEEHHMGILIRACPPESQ